MGGDYPSSEFQISEEGDVRRVIHLPTGIIIETMRSARDPISVSTDYTVDGIGYTGRPGEIVQAGLRHLRVWLMRRYDRGWSVSLKER